MSTKPIKKRCCHCCRIFKPDPRVGAQQKTCFSPSCRKKRKQTTQRRWVKKNAGYFKGRYQETRDWLNKHPGYLKAYRQTHPEYVEKNRQQQKNRRHGTPKGRQQSRVDIQDAIVTQPFVFNKDRLRFVDVDIQDAIRWQVVVPVYVSPCLRRVDIQDTMATKVLSQYTSAIMITSQKFQQFRKYDYAGQ